MEKEKEKTFGPVRPVRFHDLAPAIFFRHATGREKKPCQYCDKRFDKEESIMELFTSSYRGIPTYTTRYHRECFIKTLAILFPEIITDDKFKKELIIYKLNNKDEDEN